MSVTIDNAVLYYAPLDTSGTESVWRELGKLITPEVASREPIEFEIPIPLELSQALLAALFPPVKPPWLNRAVALGFLAYDVAAVPVRAASAAALILRGVRR